MNEQKSIDACYEEIKQREISELKQALEAHNGKFVFDPDVNAPEVMCNLKYGGPADVRITSVSLDDDGDLIVTGQQHGESGCADWYDSECEINLSDIAYGHIDFITKSIPKVDCRQYITLSREMRLFCETVVMLSADLYENINERLPDFSAVCKEIVSLAQKFEKELDWDNKEETKDYLDELDKFEKAYLESVKED